MAQGLLGGVLPAIYSGADQLKRGVYGLLTNPMEQAERAAQSLLQSRAERQALMARTFANPERPFQVTDQAGLSQLTDQVMSGELGFAPAGITAFHGSPYAFTQFDKSKIGTGVGQQLEGRGMYFSKNKELAETYKPDFDEIELQKELFSAKGDINKAIENLKKEAQYLVDNNAPQSTLNETMNLWKSLERMQMGETPVKGNLYKVDIPDEMLPKMIDFNKKITEQPEFVQNILSDAMPSKYQNVGNFLQKAYSDEKLAGKIIGTERASAQELSDWLQSKGVAGIKYSESISRIGQPAENFVVFDPSSVKILERNDTPIESLLGN
jgi:oligoribonuclease (3'-5' exoribonuclease)